MRAHQTKSMQADGRQLGPVLHALRSFDGVGEEAASYLQRHHVRLGFTRQRHSGARWFDWRTLRRGIFLNAEYRSGRLSMPELAALVVHEVVHLRQGIGEALSVRGELVAWQTQRAMLDQMTGPARDPRLRHIQRLDPRSRDDLRRARGIMKDMGGPGYHVELLPLVPIVEETRRILRRLVRGISRGTRSKPSQAPVAREEDASR